MANRNFNRVQALEKDIKLLPVVITTDGSGDVVSIKGEGIESVSHSSDTYTITLQDKYVRLVGFCVSPGVQATHIIENVAVDSCDVTFSATQASVDVHVCIMAKNSSVGE